MNVKITKQMTFCQILELYQKTLDIQQKNLSTDHPEVLIIHNNLDSLYSELDQYDLMMEHLNQSLNIQRISMKIELVLLNLFVLKKYKKFVYIIIPRQNSSYKSYFFRTTSIYVY